MIRWTQDGPLAVVAHCGNHWLCGGMLEEDPTRPRSVEADYVKEDDKV